jgi:putative membrane protein
MVPWRLVVRQLDDAAAAGRSAGADLHRPVVATHFLHVVERRCSAGRENDHQISWLTASRGRARALLRLRLEGGLSMKRSIVGVVALVATVSFAAAPASAADKAKSAHKTTAAKALSDAEFMQKAAQGNMAEVQLGKVGVQRAENPDVKQFAQRMIDDHTQANDELKQLAGKQDVKIPEDIQPKHKVSMSRLSSLSGGDFDRAYMREMVTEHDEDVALFERQSKATKDADLKGWIDKTLPVLRRHAGMAQTAARSVGAATMHGSAAGTGTTGSRSRSHANR